jgi:hypothetical protein
MFERKRRGALRLIAATAILLAAGPLIADPPAPQAPFATSRADLTVRVDLQKEQKFGKWFVRMRFTVANVGLAPAPPSTLGSWCLGEAGGVCPRLDGNYQVAPAVDHGATGVVKLQTPGIPVHGSVFVLGPNTKEWQPGHYTITARADFTTTVVETNEGNNIGSAVVVIP